MSGETAAERWTPAQRVESVLLSIISLLDDAECSSPANVDAGVLLRNNPERYKILVKEAVETSKQDVPPGFVLPTHEASGGRSDAKTDKDDDRDFWADSEGEDGFGGSDTDAEMSDEEDDESPDRESENEEDEEPHSLVHGADQEEDAANDDADARTPVAH